MTAAAAQHARGLRLTGASGNEIVVSAFDAPTPLSRPPVLLLHGGGQTRHAWSATGARLAANGFPAFAADLRGHGESAWVADGAYALTNFAADAAALGARIAELTQRRPVAVGASLGGMSALLALGADPDVFAGLVLVDVTPRMQRDGVARVQGFMRDHAREGFADYEAAAEAIARYLPHRPKPRSLEGLKKNLRLRPDGRLVWHWDPAMLDGARSFRSQGDTSDALSAAAASLKVPVLLVRGGASELVGDAEVEDFKKLRPDAEIADIAGAHHMVAGDRNNIFSEAVVDFLQRRFG